MPTDDTGHLTTPHRPQERQHGISNSGKPMWLKQRRKGNKTKLESKAKARPRNALPATLQISELMPRPKQATITKKSLEIKRCRNKNSIEGLLYKVEQISPKLEQKGVKKQCKDLFRESKGLLKRRVKIEDNIQEKIQEVKGKRLQITRNWVPSTNDEKEPTPKNHCNFRTLYSRKG